MSGFQLRLQRQQERKSKERGHDSGQIWCLQHIPGLGLLGAIIDSAVALRYRQERKARTWDKNKLCIFAVEEMMLLRGNGTQDPIHAAKEIEKAAIAKLPVGSSSSERCSAKAGAADTASPNSTNQVRRG